MKKADEKNFLNLTDRYPFKVNVDYNDYRINDARQNYKRLTTNNILRMRAVKNRPKSMIYFDSLVLNQEQRYEELKKFKNNGGKVVGVFCVQVPEEVIYAAGAIPIRLSCGFYDAIEPAEEIVPKNICPLIKSSVGFNFLKISQFFELCDVIIIPTTCDGKKKMAEILSNYTNIWVLDIPNNKENPHSNEFFLNQIKDLQSKLESLTGQKVTKDKLKQAIEVLHKRTALSRELFNIRKENKIVINGRDSFLVMQVAFFDDIRRWMINVERLLTELKENIKNNIFIVPENTPRIHITGSALIWPNMKVLHTIEESGAIVVSDDSCACGQYFYNPVEVDEWSMKAMLEGICDKCLLPVVCPIFIRSDDRIDRIFELIQQGRADGVIYHLLRLCQLFDFEYIKVSKALGNKNIPLLRIETEYSEEDVEQIKTRVEAFLEMILARKEL